MKHLNESLSDIVFHYTSLNDAYSILRDGYLKLIPTIKNDSESEHGTKKYYFLSLTRSRYGQYHTDKPSGVLFKLDGRKLNQRHAGKAVDYWVGSSMGDDEMEDRLFTDEPTIPVQKNVIEVTLYADRESINQRPLSYVVPIVTLAKKKNIPVYVYDNRNDFLSNNKKNTLSLQEIKEIPYEKPVKFPDRMSSFDTLKDAMELWHKNKTKDLSDSAYKYRRRISTGSASDAERGLKSELHNRSGDLKRENNSSLTKFIEIMKKNSIKSVGQFIDILRDKWEEIQKQEFREEELEKNYKQYEHLKNVILGKENLDLQKSKLGRNEMVVQRLTNFLLRMHNYNIFLDEIQEVYPEFNKDNQHYLVNIAEKIGKDMAETLIDKEQDY